MKKIFIIAVFTTMMVSCSKVYEGQNVDPNNPTSVNAETLLRGIELANITVQVSHIQRITGMWMGQYKGATLLYKSLGEYSISGEESNDTWIYIYQSIAKQASVIREKLPNNKSYSGITKIIEANALGTAAALYGDIPFSERANDAFPVPKFDKQVDVYAGIQKLLDEAIIDLTAVSAAAVISNDIFFAGKSTTWLRVAYTLKARYFMETRDYAKAYAAALNGINALNVSWKFIPPALVADGDFNLLNTLIDQRGGFLATAGSYMHENLMKAAAVGNRNNTKTNEDARLKYYKITGTAASTELGVAAKNAPMPLVTYEENLLILAEAGLRTVGFAEGLLQLNKLRAVLKTNLGLAAAPATGGTILYEPYVAADFNAGGIENRGTLTPDKALMREIIEERYVSLYGTILPFNDARRLRKAENDVNVPIPFTTPTATKHPERVIYAQNEINANPNLPKPLPDLYLKTQVNQ
ncbi:MAG: SusD/RagB family nutrient-binding outer membrane lipoprotein [bacterium]|jgi:hypothetical protein|nr:SusD/RagB family nutrient-binding outer membrane lipoprotein [Chitinophagaceae bacterium]